MKATEFEMLLCCARKNPDAERIRAVVNESMDWDNLLALAARQGVRPLLFHSLKSVCWDAVPAATQQQLQQFCRSNAARNLFLTGELLRLLRIFEQNNLPVALFKGAVLAESVYGDVALREFVDMDMLFREADISRAERILIDCGYRPTFPDPDFRTAFVSYHGQYQFIHTAGRMAVDVHWRLAPEGMAFPLAADDVWPRLQLSPLAGEMVPSFGAEDMALFLAAHGTKEGWSALKWVCDFAEFVRKYPELDWVPVLERARRSHSTRSLLLAILLAATLLDAQVPKDMLRQARENCAVRVLADQARQRMLRTAATGELHEFLAGLDTHDRLRDRIRPCIKLAITRTVGDHEALGLPKGLWPVYFLIRPVRLGCKAVRLVFERS